MAARVLGQIGVPVQSTVTRGTAGRIGITPGLIIWNGLDFCRRDPLHMSIDKDHIRSVEVRSHGPFIGSTARKRSMVASREPSFHACRAGSASAVRARDRCAAG